MRDPRIEKLAELVVYYSVSIKGGDKVGIEGNSEAAPLLKAVYEKVLQAGGLPWLRVSIPGIQETFYSHATNDQLQYIPEPEKLAVQTFDAFISIMSTDNTKAMSKTDPEKMVLRSRAQADLFKLFLKRAAEGELRWTVAPYPTNAYAQDAEMSLNDYEDFVYRACMPDMDDPVGYWKKFSKSQKKVVDWLKGKKRIRVLGVETDLSLDIDGRPFINCDGHENMPDGEVFTGPVENSIEGHVYFSYPAIHAGREVTGVRLWFKDGKVVKASAEKNEEFLQATLDTDEGSRYVGEFAIGTNEGITQFTRQILFDEKIGGSFHMALGAGYPESGSKNESSIHWDMICDLRKGGEIRVDDVLFYKDGKFVLDL
jgi:aminopeptidase